MNSATAPSPDPGADPALAVAERQLVLLGELSDLAMAVSRVFAASAMAAAKAEQTIVSEDWFTPEVGRARACGAKDAAESFQKVSRAARLTLMLEKTVAETLRDLRAGIVTHAARPKNVGETPAVLVTTLDRRCPAHPASEKRDSDVTRADSDTERLLDIERADRMPRGSYCRLVEDLAADIGVAVDWNSATVSTPDLVCETVERRRQGIEPPGRQERQGVRAERAGSG